MINCGIISKNDKHFPNSLKGDERLHNLIPFLILDTHTHTHTSSKTHAQVHVHKQRKQRDA